MSSQPLECTLHPLDIYPLTLVDACAARGRLVLVVHRIPLLELLRLSHVEVRDHLRNVNMVVLQQFQKTLNLLLAQPLRLLTATRPLVLW